MRPSARDAILPVVRDTKSGANLDRHGVLRRGKRSRRVERENGRLERRRRRVRVRLRVKWTQLFTPERKDTQRYQVREYLAHERWRSETG